MKIKTIYILGLLALGIAFSSCQEKPQIVETEEEEAKPIDTLTVMQHIQERGKLVAVTNCEIINYNTENATPSGFEYELLSDFCKDNDLEL